MRYLNHQNRINIKKQVKVLPRNKSVKRFKLLGVTCDLSAILDFAEKKEKQFSKKKFQGQWA